ncbi:MAG: glutathionylspermidine synthase family protein [Eubacteriales bacterium]
MLIQEKFISELQSDVLTYQEEFEKVLEKIAQSTAIYNGVPIDTLFMPKFFTQNQIQKFDNLTSTMVTIIHKVITNYMESEEFQDLFPFNEDLKKLILTKHGYNSLLPIARIDFFYNEETDNFKFCEFNTDGTSAMNEDRELVRILGETSILKKMHQHFHIRSFELIDSWVDEMITIYKSSPFASSQPTIAIIDFLDKATIDEFKVFQNGFERKGFKTIIADIREVVYKNACLMYRNTKIDLVYRRAVTTEMNRHFDKIKGFIEACKSGNVCIVGPIKTHIAHHKLIFKILHMEQTHLFLKENEVNFIRKHIPYTDHLSGNHVDKIIKAKNNWIIKPIDDYGSKGVYAGLDFTQQQWEKMVLDCSNKDYLVQEYCHPFQSEFPVFRNGSIRFEKYNNITGVYVYNGKMKGILSRAGQRAVVSGINSGVTLPTFIVDKISEKS